MNRPAQASARYGPPGYRDHVLRNGCAVQDCRFRQDPWLGRLEFAHWKHWGSGHDWRYAVCLCKGHHTAGGDSLHQLGRDTFERQHRLSLELLAMENVATWSEQF